jgi:hypothetical protein
MALLMVSDLSIEDIMESIENHRYTPYDENGSLSKRFKDIKSAWAHKLPRMIKQYEKDGDMRIDPYFYDWLRIFSPIESRVWTDIRCYGVPLFPQFPAHGFFIDFANPIKKIAFECDGAAYHDKNKDMLRDEKLIRDGWIVFRVTGRECNLSIDEPFFREPDEDEDVRNMVLENWFMNSSEGVMYAINLIIFPRQEGESIYHNLCINTLNLHLSDAHKFADITELLAQRDGA